MSAGMSRRIKDALVLLAQGLQYDGEQAFQQVVDNDRQAFSGWPSLQVLPNDLMLERESTDQSDKTVGFFYRIWIPLEDTDESQTSAWNQLLDLSDILVDAIADTDSEQSLADGQGLISVMMMDAQRAGWLELPTKSGASLVCDVTVTIRYSKNLN